MGMVQCEHSFKSGLVSAKHETPEHGFYMIKKKSRVFILRQIMIWSIVDGPGKRPPLLNKASFCVLFSDL